MNVEKDYIGNLPLDMLHQILSLLDMKQAIQTCILSTKWNLIWASTSQIKLNSDLFLNSSKFSEFVEHALSSRNNETEVSAVELIFTGSVTQSVFKRIINYVYTHNITQLSMELFTTEFHKIPKYLFSSATLKHLTLSVTNKFSCCISNSDWEFPSLETLNLTNIQFGNDNVESLDPFSKCVNLKELTLHRMCMYHLEILHIRAPKLSELTITDPETFPELLKVDSPQLENMSSSVRDTCFDYLNLSTDGCDSLEKINLSMSHFNEQEEYDDVLLKLFQKLHSTKMLILDVNIVKVLSLLMDEFSSEPCPFDNLKWLKIDTMHLKQKERKGIKLVATKVRDYLLANSPCATFIMDLPPQVPHKRSRLRVDDDTLDKKVAKLESKVRR